VLEPIQNYRPPHRTGALMPWEYQAILYTQRGEAKAKNVA